MKISVPTSKKIAGPQLFCSRLNKAMQSMSEVEIVSPEEAEVRLHNIEIKDKSSLGKDILRLDGVYFNTDQDWEKLNKSIKKSFDLADAVVYQSKFSKRLCDKYLGEANKPWRIIYNGAEHKRIKDDSCGMPFFLAVARWRPFKRLRETIEGFLDAKLKNHFLYIIGDVSKSGLSAEEVEKYSSNSKIKFLGKIDPKELETYYYSSCCRGLIHLSWIDSCPNSVVEAICANKPVICGNFSGPAEIVVEAGGGTILDWEDTSYDLSPRDIYNPPEVDIQIYSHVLREFVLHPERYRVLNPEPFYIQNTAKEYLSFFKEVLDG